MHNDALGGKITNKPPDIWNLIHTLSKGLDFSRFSWEDNDPSIILNYSKNRMQKWH